MVAPALQLLFRLLVTRPDGDVQRRIEHFRGQRHVHVFRVAADGRYEAGRRVDPRLAERFILRGIRRQGHDAQRLAPLDPLGIVVDEHHLCSAPQEFEHDAAAHAPGAAHDVMSDDVLKHASSPSAAEVVGEFEAQQRVAQNGERHEDSRHPHEHQKRREHPAVERERMDLAVANRRQRDQRHVKRVKERPPLDDAEPERTDHHGRHQHAGDGKESPIEGPGRAIEVAAHWCIVFHAHGRPFRIQAYDAREPCLAATGADSVTWMLEEIWRIAG